MKAIILGYGLVGEVIAKDLAKDKEFKVTVVDIEESKLDRLTYEIGIKGIKADLSDSKAIKKY